MFTPARPAREIACLALAASLLAGCASGAQEVPLASNAGTNSSPAATEPLDCSTDGYACSWSEVSADVVERSGVLAREVSDRIADGATVEAAAEWLAGQEGVASVATGDDVIRFLLDGGRPVWISATTKSADVATAAETHGLMASLGGPPPAPPSEAPPPQRVVGEGREAKKALVLAPFGYEADSDAGEIAGLLGNTRGYEGNVTYLENVTPGSTNVTLDTFAQFDGYDVVYLDSFGGTTNGRQYGPDGTITEVERHGFIGVRGPVEDDFHLTEGQHVGLDIVMLADGKWYLAVSADFFRAFYPGGLPKALVFLNVNSLVDQKLIRSIKGATSELYAWDHDLEASPAARAAVTAFLDELATSGRSTAVVYHEMVESLIIGGSSFVGYTPLDRAGMRIRETAWVRHPDGGGPLADGAEIAILGELGDDKPDTVVWIMDVDGVNIPTGEPEATSIAFYIDTLLAHDGLVSELEQLDERTFRAQGEFELPYDLEEDAELTLEAIVNLPDGGTSRHKVTVEVTDTPRPDIGTVWKGQATAISDTIWPGVTITRTATVEVTRDRDEEPDATKVDFLVTAGTMTWKIDGASETCSYAGEGQVRLDQGDDTGLTFDLSEPGIVTYSGDAGVANGPRIEVAVSCGDSNQNYVAQVEGDVWFAPPDEVWVMDGPQIAGTWRRDSTLATTYTWSFSRVR